MYYGGYTEDGRIVDGRYYLEYKGKYTEVSQQVWQFLNTIQPLLGVQCWAVGALGMAMFFMMTLYEKGRFVTTVSDALVRR